MKIFLVGMPGSGKSVLGKELSAALNLPFIDLDAEVEKNEGEKIAEIFSEKGEYYFREIEAGTLRTLSDQKEFVMATGGGTPCFHNNMEFINQSGTSIFINTPLDAIASRASKQERQIRPLFNGVSDDQFIQKLNGLLQTRIGFYQQANFTISKTSATVTDVLQFLK